MKKLTLVSPFLLMLLPVLVMVMLTIADGKNTETANQDLALKSKTSQSVLPEAESLTLR